MSSLSLNNRAGQISGTATVTAAAIDVTSAASGMIPPIYMVLRNTGAVVLQYSTTNGTVWNTLPATTGTMTWSFLRGNVGGIFEILVKTASGTTTYEVEAAY